MGDLWDVQFGKDIGSLQMLTYVLAVFLNADSLTTFRKSAWQCSLLLWSFSFCQCRGSSWPGWLFCWLAREAPTFLYIPCYKWSPFSSLFNLIVLWPSYYIMKTGRNAFFSCRKSIFLLVINYSKFWDYLYVWQYCCSVCSSVHYWLRLH